MLCLPELIIHLLRCKRYPIYFNLDNTFALQDCIHEKQISRSSMATAKEIIPTLNVCPVLTEVITPKSTPNKTPRKNYAMTPKVPKENIPCINIMHVTPKGNLLTTPNRLTRSQIKLNNDGFATPRAPLSTPRPPTRQNTVAVATVNTPPNVSRSKSHTHLIRAKNLPPII